MSRETKGKRFSWKGRLLLALGILVAGGIAVETWRLAARKPAGGVVPGEEPSRIGSPDLAAPFHDVTAEAGIAFRHEAGARGKLYNPETFGSGCGWLDYDGDGRLDLLFVNSNLLEGPPEPSTTSALYRNLGNGRFEDVTEAAGLAFPVYGMGFVSGDVDNDGDQDLLLYGLHRSPFFTNLGDGTFREATVKSGLGNLTGWVCAATFLDYDRDGLLDLFVGNYVRWSLESERDVDCTFGTPKKKYCPVALFEPTAPQLFRGRGDGTFQETTKAAGLSDLKGKALGVAVEDYDRDGFPDLLVANDSVPNFLLHNSGDGTFEDRGIESGFATDADGAALAGMGIDTAWAPDGGPLLTAVGNFSGEPATFHVQEDRDYFVERSLSWGIGRETLSRVTFGLLLLDADLNGVLDLLLINGHVFDVEDITGVPYAQKPQLFLGIDWERFQEVRPAAPKHFLNRPIIGRSVAAADYDGDGDLDLAVTVNQGPGLLLRNDLSRPKPFVRLELRGTKSHRDAFGAEVTLHTTGPRGAHSVRRTRKAVSSYLAQSERQLTFGLPEACESIVAEVLWPSGLREYFEHVDRGREVVLVEGSGRQSSVAWIATAEGPTALRGKGAGAPSRPRSNPVALRHRAVELYRMAKFAEALDGFQEVVRQVPDDFVSQRFALMTLFRLGRPEDVDRKISEIVDSFPDATLLVSHFALVLRDTGYRELAERIFREAVQLDPRRVDVWVSLGNAAFRRNDLDESLRCYLQALRLKSDSVEALANVGKVHAVRKHYEEATAYLERSLELRPQYATALSTLGGILIEQEDLAGAEAQLTRALELPGPPETRLEIHGNLGILYYKRGDRSRARDCFQKVLEIDPDDRQARAALERLNR